MLRFVPFAVSEFGSLAPHVEDFLVELAKASHTHTGQKIGQLLFAWRRRFSVLINMAHADNVVGGAVAGSQIECERVFSLAGLGEGEGIQWEAAESMLERYGAEPADEEAGE
eukprot:jgi/Tetstr1/459560/TSEL_004925.t1